jgi:hypothetical protein
VAAHHQRHSGLFAPRPQGRQGDKLIKGLPVEDIPWQRTEIKADSVFDKPLIPFARPFLHFI